MIDTHCHLSDVRLEGQLDDVLARAAAAGVTGMVSIGTDLADDARTIALCAGREQLRCAVGIHPNHAHEVELDRVGELESLAQNQAVVAVGEIGLDYHYGLERRERQIEVFTRQLDIAVRGKRPVIIHCREAMDDCLSVLRGYAEVAAVFHCFTGTVTEAKRVLDAGYLLGYTGVITFKKSQEQRDAVALTPPDRLLVETDAPYLSPEPHRRQQVNEPALVVHVADMVAQIKGVGRAEIDEMTTRNARRFLGWGPGPRES